MSDGYRRNRTENMNVSGGYAVSLLTSGVVTLQAPPGDAVRVLRNSIFLQCVYATVTNALAGGVWSVQSTGDSPTIYATIPTDAVIAKNVPNYGPVPAQSFKFDFGPVGIALPVGTSLTLSISGGGASGIVTWEAYAKLTAVAGIA